MVSYVLTFMLGATVGGLVTVFAVACCVVASEHHTAGPDGVYRLNLKTGETIPPSEVGGTDD